MKFAILKCNEENTYMCTEFDSGPDPYEMTFTPQPCLLRNTCWRQLEDTLNDSDVRLTIFENEDSARYYIQQLDERFTYSVVLIADLDTIVEEKLLKD